MMQIELSEQEKWLLWRALNAWESVINQARAITGADVEALSQENLSAIKLKSKISRLGPNG